jgi:hypothetical protein
MNAYRNAIAGKLISLAWRESGFQRALVEDPEKTLRQSLRTVVPKGVSVKILRSTDRILFLVLGTHAHAFPRSSFDDLRDFSESYTDPALQPLVWCARDPTLTKRLVADTHGLLARWGVRIPQRLRIRVVANTPSLVHFAVPAPPGNRATRDAIALALEARGAPVSLKYAALTGVTDLRALVNG